MAWYTKKGKRSKMVRLWEIFTVKCKNLFCENHNKNNLLMKNMYNINIFQISELYKRYNIFLINKMLEVVP